MKPLPSARPEPGQTIESRGHGSDSPALGACGSTAGELRAEGVLSIARCREVLGEPVADWTDAEVLALRERLAYLADLAAELAAGELREAA